MNEEIGLYIIIVLLIIFLGITVYSYTIRNKKNKTLLQTPVEGIHPYSFSYRAALFSLGLLIAIGWITLTKMVIPAVLFFVVYEFALLIYWAKIDKKRNSTKK